MLWDVIPRSILSTPLNKSALWKARVSCKCNIKGIVEGEVACSFDEDPTIFYCDCRFDPGTPVDLQKAVIVVRAFRFFSNLWHLYWSELAVIVQNLIFVVLLNMIIVYIVGLPYSPIVCRPPLFRFYAIGVLLPANLKNLDVGRAN